MNDAQPAAPKDETRGSYLPSEVKVAATKLLNEVMLAKAGHMIVLTADMNSDFQVINSVYAAAQEIGAVPITIIYPSEINRGNDVPQPVSDAICASDLWIEFAEGYALYAPVRYKANSKGVRMSTLTGMDADFFVRSIGRVDYQSLLQFGLSIREVVERARSFEVTSPKGTKFSGSATTHVKLSGKPDPSKGSVVTLIGTLNWICEEGSLNGTLVFDGSIWPPADLGLLKDPVTMTVEKGVVIKIEGGKESSTFQRWLDELGDQSMRRIAHLTLGYHPNVRAPRGKSLEDERLYGGFQIGMGTQAPVFGGKWKAKSHTDCVMNAPNIFFDGKPLVRGGEFVGVSPPR